MPTIDPNDSGSTVPVNVPEVTRVEGVRNIAKTRAHVVRQGEVSRVEWEMTNRDGTPVDLTDYGLIDGSSSEISFSPVVRMKEALSFSSSGAAIETTAEASDAAAGKLVFRVPAEAVEMPGIMVGEIALLDADEAPVLSNRFYLFVERGLFGTYMTSSGPPTLDEIKIRLRDTSHVDSYLLADATEFDLAEICDAIVHSIQAFNDSPPRVKRYNTSNFPFQSQFFQGISAQLHYTAARHYRREDIVYQAENVSFRDHAKADLYEQVADKQWAQYLRWVRSVKVSRNLENGFGYIRSDYPW